MLHPLLRAARRHLPEPVEAVVVAAAEDDVVPAVAVHVENRRADSEIAGIALPIFMPDPLIVAGVYVLVPAVRGDEIDFAVAVHVAPADAVRRAFLADEVFH